MTSLMYTSDPIAFLALDNVELLHLSGLLPWRGGGALFII